jgi:hypothetical protein
MRPEDKLAQQVADYLRLQYPNIIPHFDTGSGGTTSIGMALRNKRLNYKRGFPDLFIAEPRGSYFGLFIELKASHIMNKNGTMKKSDHLQEQLIMLNELTKKGYYAMFGVGFDSCKAIIDEYMNLI